MSDIAFSVGIHTDEAKAGRDAIVRWNAQIAASYDSVLQSAAKAGAGLNIGAAANANVGGIVGLEKAVNALSVSVDKMARQQAAWVKAAQDAGKATTDRAQASRKAAQDTETEAQAIDRITQRLRDAAAARDADAAKAKTQKAAHDALNASIQQGAGGKVSNTGVLASGVTAAELNATAQAAKKAADESVRLAKARRDEEAASNALVKSADSLVGRYAPMIRAQEQLAADKAAFARIQKEGTLTAEQEAAVLAGLTSRTSMLDAAQKSLSGSMKLSHNNSLALNAAFINFGQSLAAGMSPMTAFVTQVGQAAPALGEMAVKAGASGGAIAAIAAPIVAATAAIAAGVISYERYIGSLRDFERANRLAGNAIGMTKDQMVAYSDAVADANGVSSAFARSVVTSYTSLGGISAPVMSSLIGLTKDFATVTGQTKDEAAAALASLFKDPSKGADELASKYNMLSGAMLDHIRKLNDAGQKAQAQSVLVQALGQRIKGAAEETSFWARTFDAVGVAASNMATKVGRAIDEAVSGMSLDRTLDAAEKRAAELRSRLSKETHRGLFGEYEGTGFIDSIFKGGKAVDTSKDRAELAQQEELIAKTRELITERNRLSAIQQRDANNNAASRAAVDVAISYSEVGGALRKATADLAVLEKGLGTNMGPAAAAAGAAVDGLKNQIADLTKVQSSGLDISTFKARELANVEMRAAGMVGPAKDKYLAQERARIDLFGTATTAAQRGVAVQNAVTQATAGTTAAIAQQSAQYDVQTRGLMGVVDAYQQSSAAAIEEAAKQQAAADALSSGVSVAQRTREIIAQGAAQQAVSTAQVVDGMKLEARWALKVAEATKDGVGARDEMIRRADVAKATSQMLAYAQAAEAQGDAELAKRLRELAGEYDRTSKSAAQARQMAAGADAIRQSKASLDYAKAELSMMGQAEPYRERALRSLQIQQQAMELFKDTSTDALRQQRDDWVRLQEQIADTQAIKAFQMEIQGAAKEMSRDITVALLDPEAKWRDLGRTIGKRIALGLIEATFVLPIMTQVVGAVPGLFGISTPAAVGGAGQSGGVSNAATALTSASNVSSIFGGPGGIFGGSGAGSLFSGVGRSIDLFAANNFGIGTVAAGPTAAGAGYVQGGLTTMIGPMATIAAGGATIGGYGAQLLGGNSTVGSAAGALTGGIPGALIGALFPAQKPSNKEGNFSIDFGTGKAEIGGQTGKKYSAENRQAAAGLGGQVQQIATALEALLPGQQIKGSGFIAVGSRDGMRAEYGGQKAEFGKDDAAGVAQWFAKQFAEDLKDGFEKGDMTKQVSDNLQVVLSRGVVGGVEQFVADMKFAATDFAKAFDEFGKAQPDQIAAQITEVAQSFNAINDNAKKLGVTVDGLSESLRGATNRMIDAAIRQANGTGFIDQAMSVRETFTKVGQQLLSTGQSGDKAVQLYGAQISALVNSLGEDENAVKNLGILADAMHGVDDVAESFARLRKQQVENIIATNKQAEAMKNLTSQSASLMDWLNGQALGDSSSLSPFAKMEEAQRQFDAAISSSRQTKDITGATKAADALLSASKPALVMGTEAYSQREAWVSSTLKNLGHELGLPGFKTGGSFEVGGWGGVDSTMVRFMATPGERVTVTRPGQQANGQTVVVRDNEDVVRALSQVVSVLQGELKGVREELASLKKEQVKETNRKMVA